VRTKREKRVEYVKHSSPQLVSRGLWRTEMYEICLRMITCDCVSGISLNCVHPSSPLAPSPDISGRPYVYVMSVRTDPPSTATKLISRVTNHPAQLRFKGAVICHIETY
jgi:hypothetical protein